MLYCRYIYPVFSFSFFFLLRPDRHLLFVDNIYDPINIIPPPCPDLINRQTYAVIIVYDSEFDKLLYNTIQ